MRTHADLRPAPSGYTIDVDGGERLHVWSDVGIVVSEDTVGRPIGVGDVPIAARLVHPSTRTVPFLERFWKLYDFIRRLTRE